MHTRRESEGPASAPLHVPSNARCTRRAPNVNWLHARSSACGTHHRNMADSAAELSEEEAALACVNTLHHRLEDLHAALRPALAAAEVSGRGANDAEAARLHASVAHAAVVAASVLLQTQPPNNESIIRGDVVRLASLKLRASKQVSFSLTSQARVNRCLAKVAKLTAAPLVTRERPANVATARRFIAAHLGREQFPESRLGRDAT